MPKLRMSDRVKNRGGLKLRLSEELKTLEKEGVPIPDAPEFVHSGSATFRPNEMRRVLDALSKNQKERMNTSALAVFNPAKQKASVQRRQERLFRAINDMPKLAGD